MIRIILIFAFSFIVTVCNDQPLKSFGFKAGGVMATQSWKNSTATTFTPEYRLGRTGGIFVEGFKVGNSSMMAEVWYIEKGFTTYIPRLDSLNTIDTLRPQLTYGSLMFLYKYRFPTESYAPYVFAGPRMDILLLIDAKDIQPVSIAHSFGDSDLGFTAGIGFEYYWGSGKTVLLEARYSPSVINTFASDSLTVKNNSFELVLGVGF